ncbi:MAG: hypothetical protein GF311_09680 [Candidatus Lokiarchaeota archaeon]|nr:hypothetical protein [Candidatus Lokiarchaeota archaeon]
MDSSISDLYLLLFKSIKGIGPKTLQLIYNNFGSFQKAFNSSIDSFQEIIKGNSILKEIEKIQRNKELSIEKVKQIDKRLKESKIFFISYFNEKFPSQLENIEDPPIGLYLKGKVILSDLEKSVSIVGSRNCSFYAHIKTREIAKDLAKAGFVIISGLARGVDLEAHIGALEGGGKTIAIPGSGLNELYPREHQEIVKDIIKKGALISEFGLDQKVRKYMLVKRNRIISGLSKASLIIEGGLDSGTTHEIKFAQKQEKKIFALKPENQLRESSLLPGKLIADKVAKEIKNASEIIESIEF